MKENTMEKLIKSALGEIPADLVIKNALVLNVFCERFEKNDIAIKDGVIVGIGRYDGAAEIDAEGKAAVPGFIDSHVHLESSLVSPRQYCRAVAPHGTVAVVADPHEITNVLGKTGFDYMLSECEGLPLDVYFTVPSCVPATPFDESGAELTAQDIEQMLKNPRVRGLAEMMNYPGVLACDDKVLAKIAAAKKEGKIIDGHAPRLSGKELCAYTCVGVKSDHECTSAAEAMEKISNGQYVMIREGTASKNLEALLPMFLKPYCNRCMLVTDDKHPGELAGAGHIDHIIRRAIGFGADAVTAYKMASYNAAEYFGLCQNGALAPGYFADIVLLDDINTVKIHSVYKRGVRIDADELSISAQTQNPYAKKANNTVNIKDVSAEDFHIGRQKVIGLVDGEILTTDEGYAEGVDISADICKLAVIERHRATGHMGVAYLKGYGIKHGAVATSVAHDSHNIIVAGTNDDDMAFAVALIKEMQGGMVVVCDGEVLAELALPIAGLMCDLEAEECERQLRAVKAAAYLVGVKNQIDPFMTLSFSSLAVIPALRLTTLGVVDVTEFKLLDKNGDMA